VIQGEHGNISKEDENWNLQKFIEDILQSLPDSFCYVFFTVAGKEGQFISNAPISRSTL
jgi:hypothetical protein